VLRDAERVATVKRSAWLLALLAACGGAGGSTTPQDGGDVDAAIARADATSPNSSDAQSEAGPVTTCFLEPSVGMAFTECRVGLPYDTCLDQVGPLALPVSSCPLAPDWLLGCCAIQDPYYAQMMGTEVCYYQWDFGNGNAQAAESDQEFCQSFGTWSVPTPGEDEAGVAPDAGDED